MEPCQIADTINFANKILHIAAFYTTFRQKNSGKSHNARAKVTKKIETCNTLTRIFTYFNV